MFWEEFRQGLREQLLNPERLAVAAARVVYVALIAVAAWLVHLALSWLARRLLRGERVARSRRSRTLVTIIDSFSGYAIFAVALVLCLRVLGVDYKAILAGAGVVGLAVGFGAQTLVRDFISGMFLLFEDLVSVGDYVVTGGSTDNIAGTVMAVGLRVTQVRAFDGTLYVIPNGELTRFGNQNRGFMRAVVPVELAYEQDVQRGMQVALAAAEAWYQRSQQVALKPPEVQGLLSFGQSGVVVRVVCDVRPMAHWQAERELRAELKAAFDAAGIEIPFPRRVVYTRAEPR